MSTHKYTDFRSTEPICRTRLHLEPSSTTSEKVLHMLQRFEERVGNMFPDAHEKEMFDRLKVNVMIAQEIAPCHDFEGIECNGVRMILQHAEQYLSMANKKKKKPVEMIDFLEVVKTWDVLFDILCNYKDLKTANAAVNPHETREFYCKIYSIFNPIARRTLLSPQYHCLTVPSLRLVMFILERWIIFSAAKNGRDRMKCFSLSRKIIADTLVNISPTLTVGEAASIVRFFDTYFMRGLYATARCLSFPLKWATVTKIKVKVPTRFKILIKNIEIKIEETSHDVDNSVKLRLLRHGQSAEFKHKLLFYVHGGAFVGPKAASLENMYIKGFASNLKGLNILCMDHPPGPESPFPIALQQVLDTYLWLISGRPDVEKKIGFHPEELVLMGDSSGGSLVSSLMVLLNEIRNMETNFKVLLPKSMILLFPKITLQLDMFPSLITAVYDQLLSIQLLMNACISYVPMLKKNENGEWNYVEDNSSIPSDFLLNPDYKVLESPILSPVWYDKLDQLSEVPLHVLALGNDPLLDEALEMGRRWKGRVRMHVVEGAGHAAFYFNYFSREGSKCVPIVTDMIRTALMEPICD